MHGLRRISNSIGVLSCGPVRGTMRGSLDRYRVTRLGSEEL